MGRGGALVASGAVLLPACIYLGAGGLADKCRPLLDSVNFMSDSLLRVVNAQASPGGSEPTASRDADGQSLFDGLSSRHLADRSMMSLLRSLLVFQLCQYEFVVEWTPALLDWARALQLQAAVDYVVRWTFFSQFW